MPAGDDQVTCDLVVTNYRDEVTRGETGLIDRNEVLLRSSLIEARARAGPH